MKRLGSLLERMRIEEKKKRIDEEMKKAEEQYYSGSWWHTEKEAEAEENIKDFLEIIRK